MPIVRRIRHCNTPLALVILLAIKDLQCTLAPCEARLEMSFSNPTLTSAKAPNTKGSTGPKDAKRSVTGPGAGGVKDAEKNLWIIFM